MQEVIKNLHQYVPHYVANNKHKYAEQPVVGDQLTVERGINSLLEVANAFTAEERREGIHFETADFHAGVKFLEVIIAIIIYTFDHDFWC